MLKNDAIALKIGTRYSIISPILLSLLGFHKVITVDITEDIIFLTFKKQIKFLNQKKFVALLSQNSIYSKVVIEEKITKIAGISSLSELFQYNIHCAVHIRLN